MQLANNANTQFINDNKSAITTETHDGKPKHNNYLVSVAPSQS